MKYFVAIGYTNQTGLLKEVEKTEDFNNDYYLKRYNIRSNFDIQITKDFLFRINANAILSELMNLIYRQWGRVVLIVSSPVCLADTSPLGTIRHTIRTERMA